MGFPQSLRVEGQQLVTTVNDVTFIRRFHASFSTGLLKRSIFFYDKFTTCFALRTFDWICAWECPENGEEDGELLVQRIDLDDDPVHAHFRFSFDLNPSNKQLPVVHIESEWMELNSKWNDIGRDNPKIAELFTFLRQDGYVRGSVDASVELKFNRDTFFKMKQDRLNIVLSRELTSSDLTTKATFTPLQQLWNTKEFIQQSDFKITASDGELLVPRYILWLGFEYFRLLVEGDSNIKEAEIPFSKSTILQVFEYAQKGKLSIKSLDDVNEMLGDFVDCLSQLRPLEHEALLCNIESTIFDITFSKWSTVDLNTLVRLLLFARRRSFVKLYESISVFIVDAHYNRFICEYTPNRNSDMYRLLMEHSVLWSIRDQRTKLLQKKTRRILRYRDNDEALSVNDD